MRDGQGRTHDFAVIAGALLQIVGVLLQGGVKLMVSPLSQVGGVKLMVSPLSQVGGVKLMVSLYPRMLLLLLQDSGFPPHSE